MRASRGRWETPEGARREAPQKSLCPEAHSTPGCPTSPATWGGGRGPRGPTRGNVGTLGGFLVFICYEAFPGSERWEGPRTPGSLPTAASSCQCVPRGPGARRQGAQRQRGAARPRGTHPGCCPVWGHLRPWVGAAAVTPRRRWHVPDPSPTLPTQRSPRPSTLLWSPWPQPLPLPTPFASAGLSPGY